MPNATIYEMTPDERVREEVRMRTKNMLDENNRIANALKKGKAEGRAEERALTVEKMRADGLSEELIRKYCGGDV